MIKYLYIKDLASFLQLTGLLNISCAWPTITASQADIDLTRKLKEGGKLLEIGILDHIILTSEKYYSFADEGLL